MIRIVFSVVGALVITGAAIAIYKEHAWGMTAMRVQGQVITLNAGGSHPEVTFTSSRGERVSFPQGGLIAGYKVGDTVEVLYSADNATEATVDTFGARYGFLVFGLVLGCAFLVSGQKVHA